jgi:hypothetical protein
LNNPASFCIHLPFTATPGKKSSSWNEKQRQRHNSSNSTLCHIHLPINSTSRKNSNSWNPRRRQHTSSNSTSCRVHFPFTTTLGRYSRRQNEGQRWQSSQISPRLSGVNKLERLMRVLMSVKNGALACQKIAVEGRSQNSRMVARELLVNAQLDRALDWTNEKGDEGSWFPFRG